MAVRALRPSIRSTTQPSAPLSMPKSAAGMGHRDTDEVIQHFGAMQAGKDAMTRAYHDACKRKGIDPAPRRSVARADTSFKDVANRHVSARTDGHPCKRRIETRREGAGRSFVAERSGDFLGSISFFVGHLGNAEITDQLCADFVSDLARLPQRRDQGKERVGMRRAIQNADDQEIVETGLIRSQLIRAKALKL